MPRTCTNSHQHNTSHHQHTPSEHQDPRTSGIEDRAYEDAAQEGQEDIDAEDPSDRACAVVCQLVRGEIGVVGADAVHVAVAG